MDERLYDPTINVVEAAVAVPAAVGAWARWSERIGGFGFWLSLFGFGVGFGVLGLTDFAYHVLGTPVRQSSSYYGSYSYYTRDMSGTGGYAIPLLVLMEVAILLTAIGLPLWFASIARRRSGQKAEHKFGPSLERAKTWYGEGRVDAEVYRQFRDRITRLRDGLVGSRDARTAKVACSWFALALIPAALLGHIMFGIDNSFVWVYEQQLPVAILMWATTLSCFIGAIVVAIASGSKAKLAAREELQDVERFEHALLESARKSAPSRAA